MWAYERSAQKYKLVQNTIGEPNRFGIKYKRELFKIVNKIVAKNIQGEKIIKNINSYSRANIPLKDQEEFSLMVENELLSLHEGNIAIYALLPEELSLWKESINQ